MAGTSVGEIVQQENPAYHIDDNEERSDVVQVVITEDEPSWSRRGTYPVSRTFEIDQSTYNLRRSLGSFMFAKVLALARKIAGPLRRLWNLIFPICCMTSVCLDPLFLYVPVINNDKKCLLLDKDLGTVAIVLRSILDSVCLICLIFGPCQYFASPVQYLRRLPGNFTIDLLSILPLPQVVIMIGPPNAMKLLRFFVIFQYVPRLLRVRPLFFITKTFLGFHHATINEVVFNLLLYMLTSCIFGAFWYFLAIERNIDCWKTACINHPGCVHTSFFCHESLGDNSFVNDFCPTRTRNTTLFDFGIYQDALDSGILEVTNFPQKFLRSFEWGLQNLSCFGQNLQTSAYVWENFFAILITISGLVFFLYLIGNMQIYLQSKTIRSEEMRLKGREIEHWKGFKDLPKSLQVEIMKYQQCVWQETRGVDVETSLNSLPMALRRSTKRELCLQLLLKVPIFKEEYQQLLNEMCERLKTVRYEKETCIVRKGDPVEEMIFFRQGKLLIIEGEGPCGFRTYNERNDFFGEILISWALDPGSSSIELPISPSTVTVLEKIEGFALKPDDLKFAASELFKRLNTKQIRDAFRYYSPQWKTWAACLIQETWICYCKKKLNEANSSHDEWLKAGWVSSSSVATTRFAINERLATRCNNNASIHRRLSFQVLLLLKPPEPDFGILLGQDVPAMSLEPMIFLE